MGSPSKQPRNISPIVLSSYLYDPSRCDIDVAFGLRLLPRRGAEHHGQLDFRQIGELVRATRI